MRAARGWLRYGLMTRFVVLVAGLLAAFGVVLSMLTIYSERQVLDAELVERARLLTSLVGANATDPLALLNVADLRTLLADTRAQRDVVEAVAFDDECRILTDGTIGNPNRHRRLPDEMRSRLEATKGPFTEQHDGVLQVTRPVWLGDRFLGGVQVTFSSARLRHLGTAQVLRTAGVGLLFGIAGIGLAVLLGNAVTRPLKRLTDATRAVADGEFDRPIPVETSDELGVLARSFNEMTRRLRETTVSRDHMDQILHSLAESLVVLEPEGTIRDVNPATCQLLGYREENLRGEPFAALLANEDHPAERTAGILASALEPGDAHDIALAYRTRAGGAVPMILSVSAMTGDGGRLLGYVCVAWDIRERQRVEQVKQEFVSTVSHELRTPITSIRGALELLADGPLAVEVPEPARRLLDIAYRNSERLSRLIDDILDIEHLESGRMSFDMRPVDVAGVVEQSIESMRAYAAGFAVTFEPRLGAPGARVYADPDRLGQVLVNLLSNAAKYSPQGATVQVSVANRDDHVRVEVRDQGPGVPPAARAHIFDRFVRLHHAPDPRMSGTGLGLSIAKALIERMGGTIGVDSEPGAGSTFFFELPEWQPR